MTVHAPFQGNQGQNQVVNPAIGSASVSVSSNKSVRLVNSGSNICHVRIGLGTQSATTGDAPLLPLSDRVFSKGESQQTVSYISAAGTTLHIQPGEGGI